jgi:agmatinase
MTFDPAGPAVGGGIFGLPHGPEEARVIIVPVPWEPTTSYRKGTARGPAAVLEASRQVDLYDRETGKPYESGIAMLDPDEEIVAWNGEACALAQGVIDAGGAGDDPELAAATARTNELSRKLDARVERIADAWLAQGKLVGVLGGDHASPFGLIRAVARRHPGVGILHVDAHADLRVAYEGFERSHASIMFNVHELVPEVGRIVQVGIRDCSEQEAALAGSSDRIVSFYDADLARRSMDGEPFARIAAEVVSALPDEVHVSFDIDGLDPSSCPATGTPVPGGLSFREAVTLLAAVTRSGRTIVGFDLDEVAGAEWDAIVGARLLYKLIGFALMSRR